MKREDREISTAIKIKITRNSEQVAYRDDVEVEAGIGFANASVGHVLKTIAESQMRGNVPVEPDVTGELGFGAEVSSSKMITAYVSGTEAAFEGDRKPSTAHFEGRTEGADKSIVTMLSQPARGKINARLQMPIGAQVPAPQIVIEECFGLSEMLTGVFGWKTDASADGLEPEFLLFLLRL